MTTANVYLNFDGDCHEAFVFYKSVFGGEFSHLGRFSDVPPSENIFSLSKKDENRIMHVSLPISKETVLFGSDTFPGSEKLTKGNNFSIAIAAYSKEDADRYFNALKEGGSVQMALEQTFWGAYFGMLTDKFGIQWMVNYDDPALVQPS